jgi:integrase
MGSAFMGRAYRRLSVVEVQKTKRPGIYADGGGLYLSVGPTGAKSWIFRFMLRGKARAMGLGSVRFVSLADAREEAWKCGKLLAKKTDPIEARNEERVAVQRSATKSMAFDRCAEQYVSQHEVGWKHPRTAQKWRAILATYAYPIIGSVPVQEIQAEHVLQIVQPLWATKTATAKRLLNFLESIFADAITRSARLGQNPARWRGFLDRSLPPPSTVRSTRHYPSLPYQDLPAFMVELRRCGLIGSYPLQYAILTVARSEEVLSTTWAEIAPDRLWIIAPQRMKGRREGGQEHRVPLSDEALDILEVMKKARDGEFVFPGRKVGSRPASNSMLFVLAELGRSDITVHGFRSTFRTWAAEQTTYRQDIVEIALAHTTAAAKSAGVDAELWRAYQRGDLLDQRRPLMRDWAKFAMSKTVRSPA